MDTQATPLIGDALRTAVDFFLGFGSDLFIFLALAAAAAVFSIYFGRDKLVPLIAGIYAAIPLYIHFPFSSLLGNNAYLSIGLFALLAFVAMMAFAGLSSFVPSMGVGFFKVLVLCLLTASLLFVIGIHMAPVLALHTFSAPTLALFGSEQAYFWWLVAPIAGVFLFGK